MMIVVMEGSMVTVREMVNESNIRVLMEMK